MLGFDVLRALIMTIQIFAELPVEGLADLGLQDLWRHSTATGAIAKRIASAEACDPQMCDHAFTAGLLHDAGKLILAANLTDRYRDVVRLTGSGEITHLAAEREVFGVTHAEIGAYLLGLWGLPDPVVEAVAFHHQPADCPSVVFGPVTAVHAANAVEHAHRNAGRVDPPNLVDEAYLARLGIADHWGTWCDQCRAGADA